MIEGSDWKEKQQLFIEIADFWIFPPNTILNKPPWPPWQRPRGEGVISEAMAIQAGCPRPMLKPTTKRQAKRNWAGLEMEMGMEKTDGLEMLAVDM